jgi:hypothetical protein
LGGLLRFIEDLRTKVEADRAVEEFQLVHIPPLAVHHCHGNHMCHQVDESAPDICWMQAAIKLGLRFGDWRGHARYGRQSPMPGAPIGHRLEKRMRRTNTGIAGGKRIGKERAEKKCSGQMRQTNKESRCGK